MSNHLRTNLTNPITGQVAHASVIGDTERTRGAEHYQADVYLNIDCGVSFSVRMTPREAWKLAMCLSAAADAAAPHGTEPKAAMLALLETAE